MRLRETLLRFVYCIMNIEYKRKLCNNEYAVDIFVHAGKFDMPALAGVGCMGPHENADPRAVDERDAAKIDDQLAVFTVDEACNRAAYFVRFFSPGQCSFNFDQTDAAGKRRCSYSHDGVPPDFALDSDEGSAEFVLSDWDALSAGRRKLT